ncbi:MAG TPA: DEAD/DEAH box helicase [Planctomycetota bacterium]|jgi:superfamily II RNA helicase|nr:DEAD/DEAH box helicase [Planctomycetota bacterium]
MTGESSESARDGEVSDGRRSPRADGAPPRRPASAHGPVTHWKGYELSPFQVDAVEAIRGGHNVLVSAPTGAGKTLVAEYAIADAVARGRRCIYTSPVKALSNQKYRDFRDDPEIDVGILTGDVTIHPTARVLIMTTEILRNSIFENPEHLAEVEYVIFDEVHYMDDMERGSVWEESLIFAPPSIRFICLSATIPNVQELGAWLREIRGTDMVVIQSSRRPVPLHHELYTARSGRFDLPQIDRARKRELEPAGRMGPAKGRRRPRDGDRGRRGPGDSMVMPPSPAPLFDELQKKDLLPALVFSFSRRDCERLARANEGRELLDEDEQQRMVALQEELLRLFQLGRGELDGEVLAMARRGIAYHHAGMLPVHKELVERMFTSGLLKLLFTTETFALGINMPARTAVFASLRKFDGVSFDYMQTRDYLQMAGRAGRQGKDDEGLVISLLSPKDLAEAPLKRLFLGQSEPVRSRFSLSFSSLLHLVERLGRARVPEAWEKSFNQFQNRKGTPKQQEKNRKLQARILEEHLAFLEELGHLEGDRLTARGKIAKQINGYELQIAELLFSGALENLPPNALAVVFVGLVFEERRRGDTGFVPAKIFGNVRARVQSEIHVLAMRAADHQLYNSIKRPDWGLTELAAKWLDGAEFEEIAEATDVTPGDLVRHFRMAVQLMRQVRRAIDPQWDLRETLAIAMEKMNRDVVDARRQLELG